MTENKGVPPAAQSDEARHRQDVLHGVVLSFQFMEEALKLYIEFAYDIIRERTAGMLPFKLTQDSVEDLPLGRLIGVFANLVDDDALVKELRDLVPIRNDYAHRAFMRVWKSKDDTDKIFKDLEAMLAVRTRVQAANDRVMSHLATVNAVVAKRRARPA